MYHREESARELGQRHTILSLCGQVRGFSFVQMSWFEESEEAAFFKNLPTLHYIVVLNSTNLALNSISKNRYMYVLVS